MRTLLLIATLLLALPTSWTIPTATTLTTKEVRPPMWNRVGFTAAPPKTGCNQPQKIVALKSPYPGDWKDHLQILQTKFVAWHYTVDNIGVIRHLNNSSGSSYYNDIRDCRQITILVIGSGEKVEKNLQFARNYITKHTGLQIFYDERP